MELKGLRFAVWDVETTGTDYAKDRVVDVGVVLCSATEIIGRMSTLVNPGIKIPSEASAIHHITAKHVADAPPIEKAMPLFKQLLSEPPDAYVAHKAEFDSSFIPLKRAPWLCTLRLARKLLPHLPKHGNQYLRYELNLDVPDDIPVHRAEADALVTAKLLQYLLPLVPARIKTIADLVAFTNEPIVLEVCNFGKYRGKKWSEVPVDYLQWLSRQDDFETKDRDLRDTVNYYLKPGAPRGCKQAPLDDDPF
jgi:exodeoxyribonuclease X